MAEGKSSAGTPPLRFVLLEHDFPQRHWDFMLEAAGGLRTWRLASPPSAGNRVPAEALADHRLAYLDYEGPVSGGRGRVSRWDAGTVQWLSDAPGEAVVELAGARLRGRAFFRDGAWSFGS